MSAALDVAAETDRYAKIDRGLEDPRVLALRAGAKLWLPEVGAEYATDWHRGREVMREFLDRYQPGPDWVALYAEWHDQ